MLPRMWFVSLLPFFPKGVSYSKIYLIGPELIRSAPLLPLKNLASLLAPWRFTNPDSALLHRHSLYTLNAIFVQTCLFDTSRGP